MVSGGEAPGIIFNSVPLDGLCWCDNVPPAVVVVFQRASPSVGPLFAPLEVILRDNFLPDLLGGRIEDVYDSLHK